MQSDTYAAVPREDNEFLMTIVTGDETWVLHMTQQPEFMMWKHILLLEINLTFHLPMFIFKLILAVFWDIFNLQVIAC